MRLQVARRVSWRGQHRETRLIVSLTAQLLGQLSAGRAAARGM